MGVLMVHPHCQAEISHLRQHNALNLDQETN
jgi:hypothetical protein